MILSGSQEESGISLMENLKVSPVTDTIKDLTAKLKNSAAHFVKNQPLSAVVGWVFWKIENSMQGLIL